METISQSDDIHDAFVKAQLAAAGLGIDEAIKNKEARDQQRLQKWAGKMRRFVQQELSTKELSTPKMSVDDACTSILSPKRTMSEPQRKLFQELERESREQRAAESAEPKSPLVKKEMSEEQKERLRAQRREYSRRKQEKMRAERYKILNGQTKARSRAWFRNWNCVQRETEYQRSKDWWRRKNHEEQSPGFHSSSGEETSKLQTL